MNIIFESTKFLTAIMYPRRGSAVSDEITACLKRTITCDDEPTSKRICREPVVIESRDCKRTITCDDEPTSNFAENRCNRSRDCKRTITCDDEPTSKRICREPL
jgi:hypothetical protein